ncbi:disease resistance protein Roq1-like [Bidens hawaiensis]|uniref:disease resistance protein Roq1-like n=1 Tax=Bidens hawaiensis TaxID=980011 RepID=UPI004049EDA6
MASSSSSTHSAPVSSSQSCKYDVFLSFRGDDTRKTFVDHLYLALVDRHIRTFKDDEERPQGESIRPSLSKAIEESRIAIVIFSKNYANSSWCLEELAYIMKCRDKRGLIVKPIFYDVEPSDVRYQKNKFGEVFAKQEAKYDNKAKLWRKVLVEVSNIAGWELKNIANGYEAQAIKKIVNNIQVSMLSDVDEGLTDENLVGMRARLKDLESLLEIGSDGVVRMVGIWGVGGSGKTTLATFICMEISHHFHSHCIVENVGEQSIKYDLKRLQEDILLAFSKKEVTVRSVMEGKTHIQSMLHHQKVLLVLDGVDKHEQLEALGGSHEWFGGGSRIIITTRDKQLLEAHKVDEIYPVRLLSHNEAIQLFNRYAYNQRDPIEDYENLSSSVVSYADGLPLALKVLGSFLYDKDNKEWLSTLSRLEDIPEAGIMETLKISYDGLKHVEKALFLDIACFFRGKRKDYAMGILEACNFHPEIGLKVLRQKALITILSNGTFDMHDLIEEMGHYIVRGEHPNNPEKHSRVWKDEDISNMCLGDTTMDYDKIEAMRYDNYSYDDTSSFFKIVSNMKKLRYLSVGSVDAPTYFSLRDNKSNPNKATSNLKKLRWLRACDRTYDRGPNFLSNELRFIDWKGYPTRRFPDSFKPMKLVVLTLENSLQKKLWKGIKHLPYLKVLMLIGMKKLLSTPNFDGLPCLQKLRLDDCYELEEMHPSLGNLMSLEHVSILDCDRLKTFPTIVHMENLKTLEIGYIHLKDGKIPSGIGELFNLQELNLSGNDFYLEID